MGTQGPNRHGKGTPRAGQFAPGEKPAVSDDADTLTLDTDSGDSSVDPVADLYDKMTYDENGYDAHGYNRAGFDVMAQHRNGTRYDDDGYSEAVFNKDRQHRNGTYYDEDGYSEAGFNKDGYNKHGIHYGDRRRLRERNRR